MNGIDVRRKDGSAHPSLPVRIFAGHGGDMAWRQRLADPAAATVGLPAGEEMESALHDLGRVLCDLAHLATSGSTARTARVRCAPRSRDRRPLRGITRRSWAWCW